MTTIIVPFSTNTVPNNIAGAAHWRGLLFSTHDEVGANVIALDVQQRKLLYLKHAQKASSCLIIDLNDLKQCAIRKEYAAINAGELKTKKLQHFLKNIFLNIWFKNSLRVIALPFYKAETDGVQYVEQAEAKAKKWEAIVSKLKPVQIIKRA
jgi:hypothetical protein